MPNDIVSGIFFKGAGCTAYLLQCNLKNSIKLLVTGSSRNILRLHNTLNLKKNYGLDASGAFQSHSMVANFRRVRVVRNPFQGTWEQKHA
jgi:hypothetical protein